ncbi:hypothetical protein I548_2313 [Mycobacterium intracellulare]|nr:hypothetical protein I548_2313 [Mycobacterium intracellulare]
MVRATSLAAHGSLAPVAGGPASTARAAPGAAAAIRPAKILPRRPALPVVIENSSQFARTATDERVANSCNGRPYRWPGPPESPEDPPSQPTSCHRRYRPASRELRM